MTAVSIICPTYRNPKCLDIFLRSAIENRVHDHTEIIIVVDGFVEESAEVIDKYEGILVMELVENEGMQSAINKGVAMASNEAIFICNDDNVFGHAYDVGLSHIYDPNIVTTVNQIERAPGIFNFVVKDLGATPEEFFYDDFLAAERYLNKDVYTDDGNIFPFLISKKWFMAVGGFDTFYDSPNVCDMDFFLKLELVGMKFRRSHYLHLYHFGSVATKKNKEKGEFTQREASAFETFEWKWGFSPRYNKHNSKLPGVDVIRGVRFSE